MVQHKKKEEEEDRGLTAADCAHRCGLSKGAWLALVASGQAPQPAIQFAGGAGLRVTRRWLQRQLDSWLDEQVERARRATP